jgi:hypothetical protein
MAWPFVKELRAPLVVLLACSCIACPWAEARGIYPTKTPTPPPRVGVTGDLGRGRVDVDVLDAEAEPPAPIPGARVNYVHNGFAGYCYTDEAGRCSFTLRRLHDTDSIVITAEAPRFIRSPSTSYGAVELVYYLPSVAIPLQRARRRRVEGHVASDLPCAGATAGRTIALRPGERTTTTSALGEFAFEGVLDGDHVLDVEDDCQPVPCFRPLPLTIAGADVSVQICPESCPPPRLSPREAPVGTLVTVEGRCDDLRSRESAPLRLGGTTVAEIEGNDAGTFSTAFAVDEGVPPGPLYVGLGIPGAGRSIFTVTNEPGGCLGDCDGNGVVSKEEILCAVDASLGLAVPEGCSRFDSDGDGRATIQEVLRTVIRHRDHCPSP